MNFPSEHYFEAATERMRQALYLYNEGNSFALAIYTGGVAVECLLRAFKSRRDVEFDERHDLLLLFAASGILDVNRERLLAKNWTDDEVDAHLRALRQAVNQIYRLWANNYRFASEQRLRSHLKKLTGYRKIRGDYLKEQAREFLTSAQRFIDKGAVQWPA